MVQISIIGAGSVMFSANFIRDLCASKNLWGSTITLMDVDKERLKLVYGLATRYTREAKAKLKYKVTTDRKEALEGTEFVLCTVKVGGYQPMETEREIAERHGYYRGIGDRVCDYYGGIGAYHQLKFFHDMATDMENYCPDAWLIETANPVFEGTNLITRETKVKTVGVCHGHFGYQQIAKMLGLEKVNIEVQIAGFNHCIWMTRFLYKGRDAYPLIDEWIEEKAPDYWKSEKYLKSRPWETEQLSPGALDMYHLYGLFPIGDTVRSASPWWHHTDLETKKKWYGPTGGFDSEIGWQIYLDFRSKNLERMQKFAMKPSASLTKAYPPVMSGEQHIPIIDAIANDRKTLLQLNVPNNGSVSGIPGDVVVEIPVAVSGKGIQRLPVGNLPKRLILYLLIPRMMRMEQILQAFLEGDRKSLLLTLMEDARTRSLQQAKGLLEEILAKPWNSEARDHYK